MATTETDVITCCNVEEASEPTELARRIADLGEWFHNIDLNGTPTGHYCSCQGSNWVC